MTWHGPKVLAFGWNARDLLWSCNSRLVCSTFVGYKSVDDFPVNKFFFFPSSRYLYTWFTTYNNHLPTQYHILKYFFTMKVYYFDGQENEDMRLPHDGGSPATAKDLEAIGVHSYHFDDLADVDKIANERKYTSRDEIVVSPTSFGGEEAYLEKLNMFYSEHIHEDEEIRYILDGAGFFDIRDRNDRWIRALVTKGDLIILPAGIYHRFTLTTDNYIKAMRLFKEKPKWIPHNRPDADANSYRQKYLEELSAK